MPEFDYTANPMLIDLCWSEINASASDGGQQLLRKIQGLPNLGERYKVTGSSREDAHLYNTKAFQDLADKMIDMLYGVKLNADGTTSRTLNPRPAVNVKDVGVQRDIFIIAMVKAFKLGMYVQRKVASHTGTLPEA